MKPTRHADLLTTEECALYLGVSEWTVKHYLKRTVDPIPSRKIVGRRWFLKSEVWPWFVGQDLDTGSTATEPVRLMQRRAG